MQSQTSQKRRRTHGAQLKASVMAACREPGASVAAVAQAHGLNANLVRKWLVGRGVKRCELQVSRAPHVPTATPRADAVATMPFVPVQLGPPVQPQSAAPDEAIEIELTRAGTRWTVRWPAAQASACASWLGELAQVVSR